MKTFSELISWELEQDQKARNPNRDESSERLSASISRKLRSLNAPGVSPAARESSDSHSIRS
jgi:hypothetical protein